MPHRKKHEVKRIPAAVKTLAIKPKTHARLVIYTSKNHLKINRFIDDMINHALDLAEHEQNAE